MRSLIFIFALSALMGCNNDDFSYVSIRNETTSPIYVLPYASEYSDGDWIQPGYTNEFYSIGIDHLNGYEYFCAYYDSVIVYIQDKEDEPIKFYSDGTTINYDPALNPFINPDVWISRNFDKVVSGSTFKGFEKKAINEDYFIIDAASIISLANASISD